MQRKNEGTKGHLVITSFLLLACPVGPPLEAFIAAQLAIIICAYPTYTGDGANASASVAPDEVGQFGEVVDGGVSERGLELVVFRTPALSAQPHGMAAE